MASNKSKRRKVRPLARRRAQSPTAAAFAAKQAKVPPTPLTKLDAVISALSAPKGATLAQLMALTGWQVHSGRGLMSGALKKKRGLRIASFKAGEERVYRIENRK